MTGIVIIDKDTIRALGLKYLIDRFFDMQSCVVSNAADIDANELSPATLFFTTPQCYIAAQDFFIPRRSRTVILTGEELHPMRSLDPRQDESTIIQELDKIISGHNTVNVRQQHNGLSQREIEVLRLVAMGYINKEIADELSISFNTVLTHRKNITAKLGIRSVSGLGFYAMMNGYISESDLRR